MKLWSEISLDLNTLKAKFGTLSINTNLNSRKTPTYNEVKPEFDQHFDKIVKKIEILQKLNQEIQEGKPPNQEKLYLLNDLLKTYKENVGTIQKMIIENEEKKVKFDED